MQKTQTVSRISCSFIKSRSSNRTTLPFCLRNGHNRPQTHRTEYALAMWNREQQTQRDDIGGETQWDVEKTIGQRVQRRIDDQRNHRARHETYESIAADRSDPRQASRNLLYHSATCQVACK